MWQTDVTVSKIFIKDTPIWLNPTFSIPINKQWFRKGISTIADFLGDMNVILPMDVFVKRYNVTTNFLEYHQVKMKIKKFLEWKDVPLHIEESPRNSSLNIFLNQTKKGVSRMYSQMKQFNVHILEGASNKWFSTAELSIDSSDFSRSFLFHHNIYKDTYLKYIQFRTLHHRFFTNEKLYKMGINKSNLCCFCKTHVDSVEHMFLQCDISLELWEGVENWIRALGMENFNISASKIVLGDLENAHFINTIILLTKKVIYNSMKKEQQPHLLNVKNETKKFYFEEKYRAYLKGKGNFFEKQFSLLSNIYNTTI